MIDAANPVGAKQGHTKKLPLEPAILDSPVK